MLDLACVILTYNEELHIERALQCIKGIAREVFVIDSFSTDSTAALAKAGGAIVLQNKFINYAKQFEWALNNAPITAAWIMRLDADEVVENDLIDEIRETLPQLGADVVGINLKRKHIFMERWIRRGGRYPLVLLRIWRRGQGRIESRWMDEHVIVWGGRTVSFSGGFSDHNLNDLTFFIEKHNKYATREAIDRLNGEFDLFPHDEAVFEGASSLQARLKRFVKERLYNRLPFGVGPLCYFLWRYIAQLGLLDGQEGLIYHFLQGFWYRFLVDAKLLELRRAVSHLRDSKLIRTELARLTGFQIE